jgi:DNA-binding transcriptional MerR regulator
MSEHLLSSQQVARQAGLTYRQVDYWSRRGLLGDQRTGSGNPRRYSPQQAEVVVMMARLLRVGFDLPHAAEYAHILIGTGKQTLLLADGDLLLTRMEDNEWTTDSPE